MTVPGGGSRWTVDWDWFLGLAFGVTWAHDALWLNIGPLQVVVGRG